MAIVGEGGQSDEALVSYLGQGKYEHCGRCVQKRRFPNIPANVLADFHVESLKRAPRTADVPSQTGLSFRWTKFGGLKSGSRNRGVS